MQAILISGSSRKDGNTAYLAKRCMAKLETEGIACEHIQLTDPEAIKPCHACSGCFKTKDKTCVMKDDGFHEVFNKMIEADIIVLGSPVYFGSASPQLMALLDRAGYVSRANGELFARKIGGPIAVARRAGQNFTYAQLMFWLMLAGMVVPGSTYWNVGFGLRKEDIQEDEEALKTIDDFADNLAWLAKKTRD